MTRTDALLQALGALAVLAFTAAAAFYAIPTPAAECRGQLVHASWYGAESGNRTASGLHFDGSQLLIAHRTLPLHTRVRVSYRGRSIVVPVEDRGPAKWTGKTVDLSHAVARRIGFKSGKVCLEVLK
jgi:rare lipoprotein A